MRSASWGSNLAEARTVSNALDSEFRHQLENVIVRHRTPMRRQARMEGSDTHVADEGMYAHGSLQEEIERLEREEMQAQNGTRGGHDMVSKKLGASIRNLEEEVAQLRNAVSAGFDIQLDIQRAIRQEVAAALNRDNCGAEFTGIRTNGSKPRKNGRCTICLEESIDSLLYSCGHMCTCSACGRGLLVAGQKCPICRAPVRDVVRVFVVNDHT